MPYILKGTEIIDNGRVFVACRTVPVRVIEFLGDGDFGSAYLVQLKRRIVEVWASDVRFTPAECAESLRLVADAQQTESLTAGPHEKAPEQDPGTKSQAVHSVREEVV